MGLLMVRRSVAVATGIPADILAMPANSWLELPGTAVDDFLSEPAGLPDPSSWLQRMEAWSGGAYVAARKKFLLWAGGHATYPGNEVDQFDVVTRAWSRIWGPSEDIPVTPDPPGELADGNPNMRHTYDSLVALDDGFVALPSGGSWGSPQFVGEVFRFNMDTPGWTKLAESAEYPGGAGGIGNQSARDPATGDLFYVSGGFASLCRFRLTDPSGSRWAESSQTLNTSGDEYCNGSVGAGLLVFLYPETEDVKAFDLAAQAANLDAAGKTIATSGDTDMETRAAGQGAGIDYCPQRNSWFAWRNGLNVYELTINYAAGTGVWTQRTGTGSTPPNQASDDNGMYGRWFWCEAHKVFYAIPNMTTNVWVFKPPA